MNTLGGFPCGVLDGMNWMESLKRDVQTECVYFKPKCLPIKHLHQGIDEKNTSKIGSLKRRPGASPRSFNRGGGGVGFIGTHTHLSPKFSFSSDFGHFILKMLENAKKIYVLRKKY